MYILGSCSREGWVYGAVATTRKDPGFASSHRAANLSIISGVRVCEPRSRASFLPRLLVKTALLASSGYCVIYYELALGRLDEVRAVVNTSATLTLSREATSMVI